MSKIKDRHIMTLLGAVIFILSVLFFTKMASSGVQYEEAQEYSHDWYYMEGNEKIPISFPADIQLKGESSFTIYNDHIASDSAGLYVYMNNAIYRPEIYLEDELLYSYEDGGLRRNPPELSYQICKGKIADYVETGTLKIVYQKSESDQISLPVVYTGSVDTIVKILFFSNAYITVITISLISFGVFILLTGLLIIKLDYGDKRKMLMLGLLLFVLGIWCATDSPMLQYLLGYSNTNMNTDFFVFMFLVIPFVGYVKGISGMEKYNVLKYILWIAFLNVIIQTVLALCNVFTYIEMVPVTHLLIVGGVGTSIFSLCKEYKRCKNREVLQCLRAFAIAGIFAIISIGIYFLKPELFYQNLFQTGLLLFVLVLMWNLISEFISSLQYKVEAKTYKQLSEVDKLTNLLNRRSFDLKISEIEKRIEQYDNVLLLFIDMNGLKRINDTYGHARGDETIMLASRCIEGAYKGQSYCYRVGGDEFCMIIENPLYSEQEAIQLVEREVEDCNKHLEKDIRFTIAVGASFLKENGTTKEITKWKQEADYKMYEDKKIKKFKGKEK